MNSPVKADIQICTDYVKTDPEEIQEILNRVKFIFEGSYQRGDVM